MSCPSYGGMTLIRPWPYEAKPPWPWRLVDYFNHDHSPDNAASTGGISSWIVFLIILFMVFWSGFK